MTITVGDGVVNEGIIPPDEGWWNAILADECQVTDEFIFPVMWNIIISTIRRVIGIPSRLSMMKTVSSPYPSLDIIGVVCLFKAKMFRALYRSHI